MIQPIVVLFILISAVFAIVHMFAVEASLYWYFWWFDIVMHSWGGVLITLGLFALGTFSRIRKQPSALFTLAVLLFVVTIWEVFEWRAGLFDPETHLVDTALDMILGTVAGLVTYVILKKRR